VPRRGARAPADGGFGQAQLAVCAQQRVPRPRLHADLALDADAWGQLFPGGIGFVVFIFGLGFGYSLEDQRRPMAEAHRVGLDV